MVDYAKGKVYKLYIADDISNCYIGSTCNSLEQRLAQHKHAAHSDTQKKCAATQFFLESDKIKIELIEEYPTTSKRLLEDRERYWIEQIETCINKNIPGQTWQERWQKNRERNRELHKQWIAEHKDQQAEYKAAKRKENPELAKQKDKEARERNKEKIAAAKKARVSCPTCKKEMAKNSLWEHTKKLHS